MNKVYSTSYEAKTVENRVRNLKKEEQKMLKKINDAQREAHKMNLIREANN